MFTPKYPMNHSILNWRVVCEKKDAKYKLHNVQFIRSHSTHTHTHRLHCNKDETLMITASTFKQWHNIICGFWCNNIKQCVRVDYWFFKLTINFTRSVEWSWHPIWMVLNCNLVFCIPQNAVVANSSTLPRKLSTSKLMIIVFEQWAHCALTAWTYSIHFFFSNTVWKFSFG